MDIPKCGGENEATNRISASIYLHHVLRVLYSFQRVSLSHRVIFLTTDTASLNFEDGYPNQHMLSRDLLRVLNSDQDRRRIKSNIWDWKSGPLPGGDAF